MIGLETPLRAPFNNVSWIYDFDGDGDPDLFGTQGAYESADLVWAENDGNGNFTVHTNIPSGTSTYTEIFMAGVAGGVFETDGPYQMAITWNGAEQGSSSQVQMITVPDDPVNETWTIENLHPSSLGEAITAGDIDDDGDLDLFQAGNWLRNDGGGTWTVFSTGITYTSTFDRNDLSDFDLDGDLDGVAGQLLNNREIGWFEAPDDPTQPWTKHQIDPSIDGSLSVGVTDMDFDGDEDIIVGEWRGNHLLFGFENDMNESGTWIKHILDDGGPLDHHDGSQLVDIDNDGDIDIMTIGWNEIVPRIFENKSTSSNCPPVIINPGNQNYDESDLVELQILASDPNQSDILTYSATGLPPTLTIDQTSGLISGTVSVATGNFAVVVSVSDGVNTVQETFLIQIGVITGSPNEPNLLAPIVYPNPAPSDATLEVYSMASESAILEMTDLLGKVLYSEEIQLNTGRNVRSLKLNHLVDGVYFVKLVSSNSNSKGVKIVLRK